MGYRMNKSENINELAAALSKFQGEARDGHKGKQGYGYKYADLPQFLDIVRPLLCKHGLAISQLCGSASDKVSVETILMHSSGQWISSTVEMLVELKKGNSQAQCVGTVISYARRYALCAIVGITGTDEDEDNDADIKGVCSQTLTHLKQLIALYELEESSILQWLKVTELKLLTEERADYAIKAIETKHAAK